MNESLFQLYLDLMKNGTWKYYSIPNPDFSILKDPDLGRGFITCYLGKGTKDEMKIFDFINQIKGNRVIHIISTFFLGVLLYQKCKKINIEINGLIQKIPTDSIEPIEDRFKYIWMLICLFHDFGYAVEDDCVEFNDNDFRRYLKNFPRRPKGVPTIFSKKLLQQYNLFRICRYGVNDHGVIGGIKLYSDLCELRERKEPVDHEHYWGKSLENDFRIASWTVACHNIYFIDESDGNTPCYRHFRLDKLVYKYKSRTIQLKNNALLFLFCLIDSIEPLKKVFDVQQLNNMTLKFDNEYITMNYNKLCPAIYEDYKRAILGLDLWLTDVSDGGTIIKL